MSIEKADVQLPLEFAELLKGLESKEILSSQFAKKYEQAKVRIKKRLGIDEYTEAFTHLKQKIEQLKLDQKIAEDIEIPTQVYRLKRDQLNNDPNLFMQIKQIQQLRDGFLKELLTHIKGADEKQIFQTLLLSSVIYGGLTDLAALQAFARWLSLHLMGSIVLKSAPKCKLKVDSKEQIQSQFKECLFELGELQSAIEQEENSSISIMQQRQMLHKHYINSMCYRQLDKLKQHFDQLGKSLSPLFQQQEKMQSYITTMWHLTSLEQKQLGVFLQTIKKPWKVKSFLNKIDTLLFKEQASLQLPILEKRWNDLDNHFWDIWIGYRLFFNLQEEIQHNAAVHYPLYYQQQPDERYPCILLKVEQSNYGIQLGNRVCMPRLWRMDEVSKSLLIYLMRCFEKRFIQQDSEDIENGDYLKFDVNLLDRNINVYLSYYANLKSLLKDKFAIITSLELLPNNHLDQFFKQIACFEQQSCSLPPEQWQLLRQGNINSFSTQLIQILDSETQPKIKDTTEDEGITNKDEDQDTTPTDDFEHYFYYENQDQKNV